MNILVVGQHRNWALERHYHRYLSEMAAVEVFPIEDLFDDYYQASILNKVKTRLGLSGIYQSLAGELLQKVHDFRPDIVLVFKGMSILPEALRQLRSEGIFLANYNPDHPFHFSSRGSGNSNVTKAIGLYDLHFCYSRQVAERISSEYGIATAMLPFGYELPEGDYDKIAGEREELSVCFVGNPDPIRTQVVRQVAQAGFPVAVFGHGWHKKLAGQSGLEIHDAVYGLDYWRTLRRHRVQLNIFRPHNAGSHNMRTFEVPAAGGIMLAPDSEDHRRFFTEGKELFTYSSQEDMLSKIEMLVGLSANEANAIRKAARQRSVSEGYDYRSRAGQLYKSLVAANPGKSNAPAAKPTLS